MVPSGWHVPDEPPSQEWRLARSVFWLLLAAAVGVSGGLFLPREVIAVMRTSAEVGVAFLVGMVYAEHGRDRRAVWRDRRVWQAAGLMVVFVGVLEAALVLRAATSMPGQAAAPVPAITAAAAPTFTPLPPPPTPTVTASPSPTATSPPTATPGPPTYRVHSSTGVVNLRSSPELGENVIAQLPNGTLVQDRGGRSSDRRWSWIEVYAPDLDATGWIVQDLLQPVEP